MSGGHFNYAVLLRAVGDMNAFINGKTGDLAEIMIDMRTDRADPVRTERHAFRLSSVGFKKSFFTFHLPSSVLFDSSALYFTYNMGICQCSPIKKHA